MKPLLSFLDECSIRKRQIVALAALQLAISALTISLSQILKLGIDSIQLRQSALLLSAGFWGLLAALLLVAFEALRKLFFIRLKNRGTLQLQSRLMERLVLTRKALLDRLSPAGCSPSS